MSQTRSTARRPRTRRRPFFVVRAGRTTYAEDAHAYAHFLANSRWDNRCALVVQYVDQAHQIPGAVSDDYLAGLCETAFETMRMPVLRVLQLPVDVAGQLATTAAACPGAVEYLGPVAKHHSADVYRAAMNRHGMRMRFESLLPQIDATTHPRPRGSRNA